MRIPHRAFPARRREAVAPALDEAEARDGRARSCRSRFVMAKGTVRDDGLDQKPPDAAAARARGATSGSTARARPASRCWSGSSPSSPTAAAVIATTGKCGRELFTLADRPQHLYQVGSMGGASAMGLGVALNTRAPGRRPRRRRRRPDEARQPRHHRQPRARKTSSTSCSTTACTTRRGARRRSRPASTSPRSRSPAATRAARPATACDGFERALRETRSAPGPASDPRADRARVPGQAGASDRRARRGRPPLPAVPRPLPDPRPAISNRRRLRHGVRPHRAGRPGERRRPRDVRAASRPPSATSRTTPSSSAIAPR